MTSRLPTPGGDTGTWGKILNDFLSQSLNPDGSLKPIPQSTVAGLTSSLAAKAMDRDVVHKLDVSINVKEYGAAGNGTTDDTAALQAAIDAAGAGGSVYVPPGILRYQCPAHYFGQ